jgi:hypothetical protein
MLDRDVQLAGKLIANMPSHAPAECGIVRDRLAELSAVHDKLSE